MSKINKKPYGNSQRDSWHTNNLNSDINNNINSGIYNTKITKSRMDLYTSSSNKNENNTKYYTNKTNTVIKTGTGIKYYDDGNLNVREGAIKIIILLLLYQR